MKSLTGAIVTAIVVGITTVAITLPMITKIAAALASIG